jgi:hypothetical protein
MNKPSTPSTPISDIMTLEQAYQRVRADLILGKIHSVRIESFTREQLRSVPALLQRPTESKPKKASQKD